MAIVIMQKFPCSEKGRKTFNDILRAEDGVKKTRTFDGLISAEILFDDESNDVVGISVWESRAHFEEYMKFRIIWGIAEKLVPLLTGVPEITYLTSTDI